MTKERKSRVPVYETKNGVTIDKLKAAGNVVKIKHIRFALYAKLKHHLRNNKPDSARAIAIPSTFRKDPNYTVLPKGGYTHITIKNKDDVYFCVSSECSMEETFCYRKGIVEALDRLNSNEVAVLL
jgi:hypothetical protein